jgi:hypothetical protein
MVLIMPNNVTGIGTTWNLPNYAGELFTADPTQTPFLSMIGGLTGGKQTDNYEFPTAVLFDYPAAAQPEISETASATAPAASAIARSQESNVVQIHQEVIDLTYAKLSNGGRMSGINTAGQNPNPSDEKAWQIQQKLIKIARDVEYSFLRGSYQKATSAAVANKTRGMLELAATVNTIDGASGAITTAMIKELMLEMANNGAYFNNMVLFAGAKQKQKITSLYENQLGYNKGAERNVGGMNITEIETDFCKLGIVWDRFMPDDSILIADMAHIAPVFQAVPGKGVLFEEELAKVGASDRIQLYAQIGLAHGPAFLHGSITGLA